MSKILDIFDTMNGVVRDTFSDDVVLCTYTPDPAFFTPAPGQDVTFLIKTIPLDPIRSEGPAPSNFTIRWAAEADFTAQGYLPASGHRDMIAVEDGTVYMVEQVQGDSGNGVRLICKKRNV